MLRNSIIFKTQLPEYQNMVSIYIFFLNFLAEDLKPQVSQYHTGILPYIE